MSLSLNIAYVLEVAVRKMLVAQKRKRGSYSLHEKAKALRDLEKGLSNKDVASKYGVPKNTISTWLTNKDTIFKAVDAGNNVK